VHDTELNTYHNLKNEDYSIVLKPGEYNERFELTFSSNAALSTEDISITNLHTYFSNEKGSIIIHNPNSKTIQTIELYNILGQRVLNSTNNTNEDYIELKTTEINSGTYIIKLKTKESTISKKVLVE
jgi:hypothetical protein